MEFLSVCNVFEKLEKESSSVKKTCILSDFFSKLNDKDLEASILLSMGRVFPNWSQKELGLSTKMMIKILSKSYNVKEEEIYEKWIRTGDLGEVAKEISSLKTQKTLFRKKLELLDVFEKLKLIADIEGKKSQDIKINNISSLLLIAEPLEAKFITRIIIKDLRIGVAEGIIRDSLINAFFANIYWVPLIKQRYGDIDAFLENECVKGKKILVNKKLKDKIKGVYFENDKDYSLDNIWRENSNIIIFNDNDYASSLKSKLVETVEKAIETTNDHSKIGLILKNEGLEGLKDIKPTIFRPIKVMLAQKVDSIEGAFKALGDMVACEYKYDGFRVQIHGKDDKIKIYTRRLEDVTKQFPDIVEYTKKCVSENEFILDGEAVGFDNLKKKYLPFQNISQRIKRKYGIDEIIKKISIHVNIFDILFLNGTNTMNVPFAERRKLLKSIIKESENFRLAEQITAKNKKDIERFYKESLNKGNEGIMIKSLESPYKPGSRVGYMLKLKPVMETLDLTIIGAEWGEGKRKGWLTSYYLACKDKETGEFLEIGKMSTGVKEKTEGVTYEELTDILKKNILSEKGKYVKIKPSIVIEVAFEEIQKSPNYDSGYALRFPRFVRLREDVDVDDVDDIEKVESLYSGQA